MTGYYIPFYREEFKPRVTMYLIFINFIVFLLEFVDPPYMFYMFGLIPRLVVRGKHLWSIGTHMFLHGGFLHILFNMYALFVFGPEVEKELGTEQYLVLYFMSGISGAILHIILNINSSSPAIGASGAIFGVMAAYAVLFPKRKLGVFVFVGFIVASAWVIVLAFVALEFLFLVTGLMPYVSHGAHIGGFLFGFLMTYYLKKKKSRFSEFQQPFIVYSTFGTSEYYDESEDWEYY